MFPILIIAIGIAVLVFGKRLAVLGAAVGAILGVVLLRLFNVPLTDLLLTLALPGLLAVIGFFVAGFAKGIINIVLMVFGALAGAAIVLAFFDLFNLDPGIIGWILAAGSLLVMLIGVLTNLQIYFAPSTLFVTLGMLILFVGGIALIVRSLLPSRQ